MIKKNKTLTALFWIVGITIVAVLAYSANANQFHPADQVRPGIFPSGMFTFQGNIDMNDNKIINVSEPTNDSDVATKNYVDNIKWLPSDVKNTSATHDGDFGGYDGIYDWIQNNGCAGYHVCSLSEVIAWAQAGNSPHPVHNAYYTAESPYTTTLVNCDSWTLSSNEHVYVLKAPNSTPPYKVSTFWTQNACGFPHIVACCK